MSSRSTAGLWYPPPVVAGAGQWPRDAIFDTIAAAIAVNTRYASKISYGPTSMVLKVELGIRVEILPAVMKGGTSNPQLEPFVLFRPESQQWEDGWARAHQYLLTQKNTALAVNGNFKPMIKLLKHLGSYWRLDAVSFHLECLLYSLPSMLFVGGPADYVTNVLTAIASRPAATWYQNVLPTPCGDRDIFTHSEWDYARWTRFHTQAGDWLTAARHASTTQSRADAIAAWQFVFGDEFFPASVQP
jgi:hypothetical protein